MIHMLHIEQDSVVLFSMWVCLVVGHSDTKSVPFDKHELSGYE